MSGRRASLVFLPVFFASGFAALAYQIVWQRLLAFVSGADVFSVTLIVSEFMAGLGLGSLAGGHLADRLSFRGRFRAFALAEAAIAAFALVSVPLLYDVVYLEYFAVVRSRLRPGGYAVTWCPTPRVRDTMLRSFPYVLEVGPTLVASDAPIAWDPAALVARVREPFAAADYRRGNVDGEALVAEVVASAVRSYGPEYDRSAIEDVNTDLFPKDEYLTSSRMLPSTTE